MKKPFLYPETFVPMTRNARRISTVSQFNSISPINSVDSFDSSMWYDMTSIIVDLQRTRKPF
jgi:hypothetical protein